jgi:tetratricopeptide (TPR) repeat protein
MMKKKESRLCLTILQAFLFLALRISWISPIGGCYQPIHHHGRRSRTAVYATVSSHAASSTQSTPKKRKKQQSHYNKYNVKRRFAQARQLERHGQWRQAVTLYTEILQQDDRDAHAYLALARLQAKRNHQQHQEDATTHTNGTTTVFTTTREIFWRGTTYCPNSIHLWQAWGLHEANQHGDYDAAADKFEIALTIDPNNPYVCHAYGHMEYKQRHNISKAKALFQKALSKHTTAALVCSLGELYIQQGQYQQAKELYKTHVEKLQYHNNHTSTANHHQQQKLQLQLQQQQTEVYLAMAWLEERYLKNYTQARQWIECAIRHSPRNGMAQVALARLESRTQPKPNAQFLRQRLEQLARNHIHHHHHHPYNNNNNNNNHKIHTNATNSNRRSGTSKIASTSTTTATATQDGRVYNAWAHVESKAGNYKSARSILKTALETFPNDHMILQAAGKVEEQLGNWTGARTLYSASLAIQPSAPTLVAYALLEIRQQRTQLSLSMRGKQKFVVSNHTRRLFEEALLLDPRHGPAYNAYARSVNSYEEARDIYERGVRANCTDPASLYHGYARLELSMGNVNRARELLWQGQRQVQCRNVGTDSPHRDRAVFLTHTLGMLELNSNRPAESMKVFQDGIERYGNSSQLLLGAALCQVKLGNEQRARELFERSVAQDHRHAQAWQAWGVMEMRSGNLKTAKILLECGIKCAPRHGALWQAYAVMETRVGNIRNARSLFQKGIRLAPQHVPLYQSWATMELREGNYETAKSLISQALTRNKRNGSGWLIAAEIEERLGNQGLKNLLLRRGIECSPASAELYRALGDALVRQGRFNEAREIMERGIEMDPMHAPLYHSLAELEARVFNLDGLNKLNKRAAAIFTTNVMEPSPSSSDAWGYKIRAGRWRNVPEGVAALAERIVDDEDFDPDDDDLNPSAFLSRILDTNMLEEGLVDDLLNNEKNITVS